MLSPFNVKLNPPILTRTALACQIAPWQRALADAFTQVDDLLESLGLRAADISDLDPDPHPFQLLVPREFAALMRPGDPGDPLLRQVLPLGAENRKVEGFITDPVGDAAADRGHGLLRKYAGRALLIVTGACAIHCRYCFRRHFPYAAMGPARIRGTSAIAQLAADMSLSEVILSGGDPLMFDDDQLGTLILEVGAIAHLQRLRIHTRLPVILPARINERLCEQLAESRLAPVVVIHVNHPNELGQTAQQALRRLRDAGVTILNQSVLLRGVNDDSRTLCRLSERLFACGALPYYIHQLDPVDGAAHFQTNDAGAKKLIETIREQLPGYLVPRLVRETAGAMAKMPIN